MRDTKRLLSLVALLLTVTVLAVACGGNDGGGDTSSGGSATPGAARAGLDYSKLSGSIKGSGSSFTDAFLQEAIAALGDEAPDLEVTYNAIGSGAGKQEFGENLTDFAGTDSLVKPGDGPAEGSFFYVPTVAAPITVSFNLRGVDELRLSPETLAKIFQRDITKWDDPAIKADNPSLRLPSKDIVVAHRADGSGTTSNFTKYLDAAAPGVWRLGGGDTVAWPADTQAGQKNTGVAQIIKDNDGAIGYVDYSDAKATGLKFAAIENKAGRFVEPTLAAASAAIAGATVNPDLTYNPLNADGADSYPITAPTFVLIRATYRDQKTLDAVKGFLTFVLTHGQDLAESVDFAKLPEPLRKQALAQLDKPTVG